MKDTDSFDDFAEWMRRNRACVEAQAYAESYEGKGKSIAEVFCDLYNVENHPQFEPCWAPWLLDKLRGEATETMRLALIRFMRRDKRDLELARLMNLYRRDIGPAEKELLR